MQEIALYDPERRPPNWTDLLRPGQYAVLHSDVGTDVEKTTSGKYLGATDKSTCLVFDSLPEAEAYCEAKVDEVRTLRCDIYDHAGKSKPPLVTYVHRAQLKRPRRRILLGWALIAASLPCFWIDWQQGGALIFPTVIGINMIFVGLRLIYWGAGGSAKRQAARKLTR
jgi:hypothetical protein